MTVNLLLALILLSLMVLIGGLKGAGAFLSLWINFGVLFVMIILINWGFNIFVVLMTCSIIVLMVTILSTGADEETILTAVQTSIIVMVILMVIIIPMQSLNEVQGFAVENSEELEGLTLQVAVSFVKIGMAAALLATLGAIAEAAVAIASGFFELTKHHPDMPIKKQLQMGQHLGEQIIGTAVNTVLFGFMADFLSLGIMFVKLNYSFADVINNKLFVATMLSMLYAFLGIILVLPITLILIRLKYKKTDKNN
ncbi:YibE/F family protein [Weissella diestrammenae]|uniref:YibE/F family protein n=1 Tax=Weissella diestrammenae TaxID=1162633 RepID=A0A7G9T4W6_9LACO|nr:YibE/F family protein [Weissella diestrammenae]MCM0582858.1 YibE/F family protein [Weissella diestrammenae]QNN75141.1 YibE/F family protein [Weissella diestrammenae]